MIDFSYARPQTAVDSVRLGATTSTAYIAGGTELLNWMRLGIAAPANVVDIGRVHALRGIREDGDHLWIGALTTLAEIEADSAVRRRVPALAEACLRAASPQIRNRATLGGNVLQKTRCAYFRADEPLPWPCNKRRPGSGCAALEGSHERHAIFGWTEGCVATQPSDPVVVLSCLDADVDVLGSGGSRAITTADLLLSQQDAANLSSAPGSDACLESRLQAGELITAFRVPTTLSRCSAYVKVRERESYEYAMVSAAAAVMVEDGVLRQARIALGSVAQKPWRLRKAEEALVGRTMDRDGLMSAVELAMADAHPLPHNAFKQRLAAVAAVRALEAAARVA
jgi:xanthine dehydrogenase YagS FAD-binding subunit